MKNLHFIVRALKYKYKYIIYAIVSFEYASLLV